MFASLHRMYHSFRSRLIFVIALILFTLLSIYFAFFIQRLAATLNASIIQQGENLVKNLGYSSELGVLAGDPTFVDASVAGILEQKDVVFVAVYNKGGDIISSKEKIPDISTFLQNTTQNIVQGSFPASGKIQFNGNQYLQFVSPISIRTTNIPETSEAIGYSRIVIALDSVRAEERNAILLYGLISIVIFLGAGIAVAYFTRRMTRSMDRLMAGVQNITAGQFDQRIVLGTKDEFGRLADAFNQMVQSLHEAREREKEVSRMKSEFVSIAAHQLRTPLTGLKWMFNIALDGEMGKMTAPQKELLQKGAIANQRMISLVNDLLDVVRIEEGKFGYLFERVSIEHAIIPIIEDMSKAIADSSRITVVFHKPSHHVPDVQLDMSKFPLAFSNILENAIHYTRSGGRVDIEVTAEEDHLLLTVRDTGIGIPTSQYNNIFNKFFRADNAVRAQPDGSGLGLFIAKNIIEKHHGKIWIESEENKGTTVFITLPITNS